MTITCTGASRGRKAPAVLGDADEPLKLPRRSRNGRPPAAPSRHRPRGTPSRSAAALVVDLDGRHLPFAGVVDKASIFGA
jgi:hypothetical protein